MLNIEPSPSVAGMVLTLFWCALFPPSLRAQGSTDYLAGKAYVIRVGGSSLDRAHLEADIRPRLDEQLAQAEGLLEHIRQNLFPAKDARDGRWFMVYFSPTRQTKEDLLRDFDLLVWSLHGHEVQILPIELLQSPERSLVLVPAER